LSEASAEQPPSELFGCLAVILAMKTAASVVFLLGYLPLASCQSNPAIQGHSGSSTPAKAIMFVLKAGADPNRVAVYIAGTNQGLEHASLCLGLNPDPKQQDRHV
jgi:hypothetical protein